MLRTESGISAPASRVSIRPPRKNKTVVCDPADSEDVLDALQDTLGYMAFSTQTRNPDICKAALDRVVFDGSADAEAIKKYYAKNTRRLLKGRVNNG